MLTDAKHQSIVGTYDQSAYCPISKDGHSLRLGPQRLTLIQDPCKNDLFKDPFPPVENGKKVRTLKEKEAEVSQMLT